MKYLMGAMLLVLSMNCFSSQKNGVGEIIRMSVYPNGDMQYRTIDVEGFDKSGVNCYQSGSTNVITMLMEDDAIGNSQYSMALAAYMSGKKVRVKVDDSKMIGSFCTLRLIQICKSDDICI